MCSTPSERASLDTLLGAVAVPLFAFLALDWPEFYSPLTVLAVLYVVYQLIHWRLHAPDTPVARFARTVALGLLSGTLIAGVLALASAYR